MAELKLPDLIDRAADLVEKCKKAGADAADCVVVHGASTGVTVRNGELEEVEQSDGSDLGLRAFVNGASAIVSATGLDSATLNALPERVVAMAKAAPPDPYAGIAASDLLRRHSDDLDLSDGAEIDAEQLKDIALRAEGAALAVGGITNSEGADASAGAGAIALATSNGFEGGYRTSSYGISCSVLAGEGLAMQRDYDWRSTRHFEDLPSPETIGKKAADQAVARLNPQKPETAQLPVVYDPRVSSSLVGHLASALNGSAIAKGTSFLKDAMGEQIFAEGINITDDPTMMRGLASKPFDGEGLGNPRLELVKEGVVQYWLLDLATGRQLELASNGRAARGTSSAPSPSPTNLYMAAGQISPTDLIGDIEDGIYVNELMGSAVSLTTGDYSRGGAGFRIRKGKLAEPISEITIAGNLKEMFKQMTAANDLEFRMATNAPTIRIDRMMVAGA